MRSVGDAGSFPRQADTNWRERLRSDRTAAAGLGGQGRQAGGAVADLAGALWCGAGADRSQVRRRGFFGARCGFVSLACLAGAVPRGRGVLGVFGAVWRAGFVRVVAAGSGRARVGG
jgi:hypothetical protein